MREWTVNIENNEKIEMISLTEDFLAVGTSQRLIRLISLSGIQQRIIRLQAPIVSMSAYQNQLWIVHYSTQGLSIFSIENTYYHSLSFRSPKRTSDVIYTVGFGK